LAFPSGRGGVPIIGSPFLPDHWAYGGTFGMSETADAEAARSMLAEAGHPDGLDAALSVYTNFPFLRLPAEPIQAQLAEAGIRVELRLIEGTAFAESLNEGDFQVALYGNSGLTDPDDWFTGPLHSESGSNVVGWADPTADELMERGRTTVDQEARKAIYDELTAYVIEQAPIAWVYHTTQFEGFAPYVKGFEHWANTSHLGLITTWLDR
jgi:peptide/nickel transport system substrate-binding protein